MLRARLPKIAERRDTHGRRGGQAAERRADDPQDPGVPGGSQPAAPAAPDCTAPDSTAPESTAPDSTASAAGRASSGSISDRGRGPRMPAGERAATSRAREAGGPLDRASYVCSCGYAFTAPVSSSVRCPVCGSDQAW